MMRLGGGMMRFAGARCQQRRLTRLVENGALRALLKRSALDCALNTHLVFILGAVLAE